MSKRREKVGVLFIVVLFSIAVSLFIIKSVLAHGSMQSPVSRVYGCFLEGPESPTSDACLDAVEIGGVQPLYDWNEVSIGNADGNHQALISDGQLCSAARTKYAGFDQARADWPATEMQAGNFDFIYKATAPHHGSFEMFITKPGYDPTQPLKWSDLELFDTIQEPLLVDSSYHFSANVPERTGRHLIFSIWQRHDSPEAFYTCSDVVFGDVTPIPTNTPVTGACTASAWVAVKVYHGNDVVSHNGHEWQAKWWTQGEEPGTTGDYGVWDDLGACGTVEPSPTAEITNTPVSPTNTPSAPTSTPIAPTSTSVAPPTATPDSGSCTSPQYVAGAAYSTSQLVQNVGNEYQCSVGGWCSSTAAWAYEPGVGMYWETAWALIGSCN